MKVLILGASGFIGLPVAQALVRAGHTVYGVTRSEEKARQLAQEEIIPIVASASDPSKWLGLVATLDVVIDTVGGMDIKVLSDQMLQATADAAAKTRPAGTPKLTYIYTSGTWVHGHDLTSIKTDTSPLTSPAELVAWRPAQEQRVVTHPVLNGIVVRPALLYGRSGSVVAMLFKGASEGKVAWFGTPESRWAVVHADDLAELYLLVAEKAQLVGGKIFDAANSHTESLPDVLKKLAEVSGVTSEPVFMQPTNLFESALSTTSLVRPYLARALLGWQPRKSGLVDNMEVYYNAWKASVGL